jgi:hypothetical protein
MIDALGLLARDAISQGIIVDADFDIAIRSIIPSYLKLVNKLNTIKATQAKDSTNLYTLFGEVLTDYTISPPPLIKEKEVVDKKMIVRDGPMMTDSDSYLEEIQTPSTNILSRALASVRTETNSLNNDVLGVVYGLDGSVEIIGRNNTLEVNSNDAPKGIKMKDSLTILRN